MGRKLKTLHSVVVVASKKLLSLFALAHIGPIKTQFVQVFLTIR
jgi:hypothetical protein